MATIQEFADKVNAEFDKISAAVDGLVVDVKTLNDKIAELQNSAGTVTPADQALLDDIQSKAANIASKVGALDAQTEAPPAPPTE